MEKNTFLDYLVAVAALLLYCLVVVVAKLHSQRTMCECLPFLKEYFTPIFSRVCPECLRGGGFQRNELRELTVELGGGPDVYYVTTYIKISRCSGVCELPVRFPLPFETRTKKVDVFLVVEQLVEGTVERLVHECYDVCCWWQ